MRLDLGTVEDDGTHANQSQVADGAGMDCSIVTNGYVVTNMSRTGIVGHVNDRAILTMFVAMIPFPELGVTEAWRSEVFGRAEDSLTTHPERFLAWGVIYYFLMAIIEFWVGWHLPDWSDEEVEKGWDALSRPG